MRHSTRLAATGTRALALLALTGPLAHAAPSKPESGTATVTVDGTTWEAVADKGAAGRARPTSR